MWVDAPAPNDVSALHLAGVSRTQDKTLGSITPVGVKEIGLDAIADNI